MTFSQFVRIDRDVSGGAQHFVVHAHDPHFTIELEAGSVGSAVSNRSVLKRVCVPNSWTGDYGKYSGLLSRAQEFFEETQMGPQRR